MRNPIRAAVEWGAKAFDAMRFPTQGIAVAIGVARSRFNFAKSVGNGRGNAAIMSCIRWMQRTYPEAPIRLSEMNPDGQFDPVDTHPFLSLLATPNMMVGATAMWRAVVADLALEGNGYLKIVFNGLGTPIQLWWLPSGLIEPHWPKMGDGSVFIDSYTYKPGGATIQLPPESIVHFRDGQDPSNIRKGHSPLRALLREVFTDDEAANYTASILRNVGVPGLVISPDSDDFKPNPKQIAEMKESLRERYGSDRRGEPMIMDGKTKVQAFGFNPQQMNLRDLRRIPEERISAVLGVPAIVAGLGAGLDRSTFSNMAEAREMGYENAIIPLQGIIAAQLRMSLLPFWEDIERFQVWHDTSEVRVLQEDETRIAERLNAGVRAGYVTVAEARESRGLPVEDVHRVFLRPRGLVAVPADADAAALMATAVPPRALPGGDGRG